MAKTTPPDTEGGSKTETRDLKDFRVKYTGPSMHRRILNAKDFAAAGIDDVTKKEWSADGNHTVDFSEYEGDKNALATFFEQDVFAGEFKILGKGEL
jgi:hypothetical protein